MANIHVDFNKKLGNIKPMHGVGQPPMDGKSSYYFKYLKEAHIPYSRLHDVGGAYGGFLYVDIPNIFRDFNADENDPKSYDFTFTDWLIESLKEYGCEPVYRLGVTIENYHDTKAYRIFPPADMEKWARVCEHIIRHYNEGWADGYHYNITYWEIWNEPDNGVDERTNMMWHGTMEQYFELYKAASTHLKACFGDSIKVGGYASCGFYAVYETYEGVADNSAAYGTDISVDEATERKLYHLAFFQKFIAFVTKEKLPLDFFSYHSYVNVPLTLKMQDFVEKSLRDAGLTDTEIHLNEWNLAHTLQNRGTLKACAETTAMMCAMQNRKMAMMCYYDARIGASIYAGMFNPLTYEPFPTYYGFKAFGSLYALGTQTDCKSDSEEVYAVAATDGKTNGLLIVNTGEDAEITTDLPQNMQAYIIDESHSLEPIALDGNRFLLKQYQVVYFETK